MKEISQMYEFVGAGPCPFPGQLQYRVVNPRGAGVFFEKNFATPIGSALRPGSIVCGTPRTDPSGMSSYVVELANGYANALDFEQLTSAMPSPVLASGEYDEEYVGIQSGPAIVGAGPCPYAGQLQYRVVNPHGAGVFFEKNFATPVGPPLHQGQIVCGTPRTDPSGMASYVVELANGYASALDFQQLTSALPSPMLASGYYAGDVSSLGPMPRLMPATGCPTGTDWSEYYGKCLPKIPPPPPAPIPLASGYFTGQGGDIPPDLYGADAIQKGCMPGMYWDGWYQKCLSAARRPIAPASFPPTLEDWRKQHATTGESVGWNLFGDVLGWTDPFSGQHAPGHGGQGRPGFEHHDEHRREEHRRGEHRTGWNLFGDVFGWTDPFSGEHAPGSGHDHREHEHHEHREHEHREHEHRVGWARSAREFVGVAAAAGDPAATAAVHAENAAVQAKSAGAAAEHPAAKGTPAASHAQAASSHAAEAVSHAQAAAAHPTPEGKVAHADQATAHAEMAASHAAAAHAAIGNHAGGSVGTTALGSAASRVEHPATQAASHAQNAMAQAHAAQQAAAHPAARGTAAGRSASMAQGHAAQAVQHAKAAASHPSPVQQAVHAQQATMHAHEAASHAVDAHREISRPGGRPGEGGLARSVGRREGFGRGREGFGRGGHGFRDAYGRFRGRRFHGEWRGYGHPAWRHGIGERWLHHRAECFRRGEWACLEERIYEPGGNIAYRITPAGEMEGEQLGQEEQQANVIYVQATGQQPPTNDDGPMPGSDQSSDGSQAPVDEEAGAADQGTAATDQGAAADQGATDQGAADQDTDAGATADAGDGSGDGTDTTTQGYFAGWQMPFTDPYGYFNMAVAPAWDSAYPYIPPDYPSYWW